MKTNSNNELLNCSHAQNEIYLQKSMELKYCESNATKFEKKF